MKVIATVLASSLCSTVALAQSGGGSSGGSSGGSGSLGTGSMSSRETVNGTGGSPPVRILATR
jgi:uncharacterized protein YdeI (BOF family)